MILNIPAEVPGYLSKTRPASSLIRIELAKILGQGGSIADYPLIYQGNIYLVGMVGSRNLLTALGFSGQKLWQEDIGTGTVQRSPAISRQGIMYIVAENQIRAYDLNHGGKPVASSSMTGKLSDYTDLAVGYDGSLFMVVKENDLSYVYGFTADLKPFIKSDPLAAGQQNISTVTVSPDGQKIFVQTPEGAVTIDITDPVISGLTKPAPRRTIELAQRQRTPLAILSHARRRTRRRGYGVCRFYGYCQCRQCMGLYIDRQSLECRGNVNSAAGDRLQRARLLYSRRRPYRPSLQP